MFHVKQWPERMAYFELVMASEVQTNVLYITSDGTLCEDVWRGPDSRHNDALCKLYMVETPSVTTLHNDGRETVGQG